MSRLAVSNTSPLNYLVLIDAVELLPRLFSALLIPPAVASELSSVLEQSAARGWIDFEKHVACLQTTNFRVDRQLVEEARERLRAKPP